MKDNNKIERARSLLNILVKVTDINTVPCDRYYFVLRIFQQEVEKLNNKLNAKMVSNLKTKAPNYFEEKRAIKEANVTSTTYERSRRALEKQIENRFKNR